MDTAPFIKVSFCRSAHTNPSSVATRSVTKQY